MKNKVKLLLADSSAELMSRISVFFEGKGDVEIVGKAADGIEATEMLRELTPDVVLMEIVLPEELQCRRISTQATDRATAQLKFPLQTQFIRWACLQILRATSICATLL